MVGTNRLQADPSLTVSWKFCSKQAFCAGCKAVADLTRLPILADDRTWRRFQARTLTSQQTFPLLGRSEGGAAAEGRDHNKNGSRYRGSHCPSWARTRTLLIQSPLAQADISDNLLGFDHLLSIGAASLP
jgi:hypothetical protein